MIARLSVGPYQQSAKMIRLAVLAITFLLQALRSEGYAYKMTSTHCSRSIASGTIMGQSIQESAVASIRLVKGGSAIACGGTLTPGDTGLTFSLSGQSGQYVIEASASAGTSSSWGIINGGCSMKRDTSTSNTFTVPSSGTVTVRATWATGYGSSVYKTPDCTYNVQAAKLSPINTVNTTNATNATNSSTFTETWASCAFGHSCPELNQAGLDSTCSSSLPPQLAVPAVKECNSDYVCTGHVLGCVCPEDGENSLRSACSQSTSWPYKRRGRCMCQYQPTPLGKADARLFTGPKQGPAYFEKHEGVAYWVVECPVCTTNYHGQLSPHDPQGCRMPAGIEVQDEGRERAALDQLYALTLGQHWLRGWDTASDPCDRFGVTCVGDRVVAIELGANNLQGQLPPSTFAALPRLERLDFADNLLSGSIPDSIGALPLLTHLLLQRNRLSGRLPDLSSCHFLTSLDVSHNRLSGVLDLRAMRPARLVPPILAIPTSAVAREAQPAATLGQQTVIPLLEIDVGYNALSGLISPAADGVQQQDDVVPPQWRLQRVSLSHNVMTGSLPRFLLQLPALHLLDASHNLFSASLPSLTSDAAAQLRRVVLRGNPISGEVPASWARLWNTTAAPGLCAAAASDDAGVLLDMACTCLHGNISSVLLASTSACIHGVLDLVATRITDCIELQALVEARRGSGGVGEMRVRCAEAGGENGGRVDSYSMTSVRADAGGLTAGNACELVRGVNGTGVVAMVLASVEVTAPLTFVSKYPIRLAVTRHCPLSGGPEEGSGQGAGGVPSGVGCGAVAVTWRTVGGDARKGIDFEEAEGVVRWAEGDTSERHVTVFVHRAAARARVRRFDVELLPAPDSAPAVLARGKERTHVRLSRCTGENSPAVFDRADPHRAGRGGRGACAADLTTVRCGDGVRDIGEACDDGNRAGNDGCSGACQVEAYWWCYGGSLTSTDVCAPMSSQLGVLGPGFKGGTRASLHAVEMAFGWMGVQGLNTSWFMRETYEGHQLYPILLKETERARQTTSSHVYNPSEDYWPAGIFWPNEYWTFTSNPLHWITSLGCADDPYDGSLAHDDDSQATDGHVATGLLALPGVQACGVLAYHKGYSGFCLGRNGRCHTHWTFFDMLERMGGVRSPAAAGAVGHVWQMPAVAGCKVRAGEEAGSDGAMSCYQLRSNPCHSDPEVYLGRASVPQHLPCSPHATCEWDGPGNSARCTCKTGFTGNGYECWLLVDERQCDGFGSAWEDGQCFKLFSSSPRPWLNAEQFCRHNWGGALASIRSEAQSAVVADLMASAGYYAGMKGAWIGLKQPAYIIATGAVTAPDWLPASLAQQTQADLVAGAGAGDGYSRWAEGEEDTFQVRSNYTRCAFVDASGLWHLSEFGGCGEHPGEHPWRTTEYRLPLCARTTPDVDECAAGLDDCDAHATCLHPIRTYNCSCDKGYTGHGRLAELELTNTLLAAYGPGVQFSASFPASPLQLSRLGADVRALPEWLDRPHAILQPEGGREGLKLEVGGIYAEADKVWIEADIGRITPLLSIGWWLYAGDNRSHARMRVEVSVSGDFAGEHILLFKCADFDDCGGPETDAGRRVPAYGIAARYVRIYVGRGSTDSTVRFLRMSLVSARHRGCAPCPILSTFEGAPPGQCVACSGAGGGSGELRRVEGAVVGCGTVAVCDGGKGSLFMGACFRYFGPSLFEVGDTPPAKPGRNASRDGAVTLERAREECRRWGGDLAVVGDRGRMEVVRALLRDQAWVGVRASDGASALKWVDGSLFDAWGGADTWGPPCIGGTRSGDCPAPPPAADEPTQCVLMGLGGVLRSASCSGRTEGGAGQGGSGGDVRVDRGVVRGWVCEKQEAGGVGADVRIELLVRSSSGNADLVDLDPGRLRVSASCGGDNCWCESVSGCACGESGAVLGRVVAGPSKEGSGGGAWRRVSVSIWLVIAKDCFVRVEHTLGRFAAVVLPVSSSLVDAYIGGGEGIVLRMVAIEPVDDVQSKGVRAVLSWGATPPDLDLHIYKDSNASPPGAESCPTCASDGSARVCSAVQPVSWISRSKFGGVALDVDDMMGYGPETVTWDDAAQDGIYHIVVHIYSSGGRWEGSDVQMSISMRNVAGITLVRPAADVLASDCPSATCLDGLCCYWWVGTVTKTQSQYQYFPANAIISKPRQC